MRIAEIAPPWVRVPPERYGGIEWIVSMLADGLASRGHEVTLYATGDSSTSSRLRAPLKKPVSIGGKGFHEAAPPIAIQTLSAYLEAESYDVIHDHTGTIGACLGALSDTPVLHTLHGPPKPETQQLLRLVADRLCFNSISYAQRSSCPDLNYVGTVHNAVDVGMYPFREEKDDYALFLGRFSEDKGAHNAIYIARKADVPLRMAGKVDAGEDTQYFETRIEPYVDGENVVYEGEVDEERKRELLAGAHFLLFPIQWEEPFGLVMIEALACGTPVVASAMGAAPEIVRDGEVGALADVGDWNGLVAAIKSRRLQNIDPSRCREYVHEHFSVEKMLDGYERAFEEILAGSTGGKVPGVRENGRGRVRSL